MAFTLDNTAGSTVAKTDVHKFLCYAARDRHAFPLGVGQMGCLGGESVGSGH